MSVSDRMAQLTATNGLWRRALDWWMRLPPSPCPCRLARDEHAAVAVGDHATKSNTARIRRCGHDDVVDRVLGGFRHSWREDPP